VNNMSITREYGLTHQAVKQVAQDRGLTVIDVRLLVALAERGGRATTDQLLEDLAVHETQLRRSMSKVRQQGLLVGGDKPGARVPLSLNDGGWGVAGAVQSLRLTLANNQEAK
jgi:DNA-binding transcriptional regulator PaaX